MSPFSFLQHRPIRFPQHLRHELSIHRYEILVHLNLQREGQVHLAHASQLLVLALSLLKTKQLLCESKCGNVVVMSFRKESFIPYKTLGTYRRHKNEGIAVRSVYHFCKIHVYQ
jgi:hypothetical protein